MELNSVWMKRAIKLAKRGIGATHPNPRVGAVVVNHGGIVGEGWHHRAGEAHAEVIALAQAGERARGGVLYVTLEPCAAQGRTPACTDAILEAGVRHVVYASADPNPVMAGGGRVLAAHHQVEVTGGFLADRADAVNAAFFHYIRTGRPYIIAKAAISLDGKLATRTHHSQWISGMSSRRHAHALRAASDAIMIGSGTLKDDNPSLTVRHAEMKGDAPVRVVLCFETPKFSPDCKLLSSDAPTRLYVRGLSDETQKWRDAGVQVEQSDSLAGILQHLAEDGLIQLLLEGGGSLHTSFLESQLVDEMVLYQAPILIGGRDSVALWGGLGIDLVSQAVRLTDVKIKRKGDDQIIRGRLVYAEE